MSLNLNNIAKLPDELIKLIHKFLPIQAIVFTNKQNYNLYHPYVKKYISNYENYIRDTMRRDNSFVFEKIMKETLKEFGFYTNKN
jgi:hypothetical protein